VVVSVVCERFNHAQPSTCRIVNSAMYPSRSRTKLTLVSPSCRSDVTAGLALLACSAVPRRHAVEGPFCERRALILRTVTQEVIYDLGEMQSRFRVVPVLAGGIIEAGRLTLREEHMVQGTTHTLGNNAKEEKWDS